MGTVWMAGQAGVVYCLAGVSPADCHHLWVARLFPCEDYVVIA